MFDFFIEHTKNVSPVPSRYLSVMSHFQGTGGSLNNTLMNATLLSTSINAHMQGMQDHLVNLLNLDGTLNHSKLMELRGFSYLLS